MDNGQINSPEYWEKRFSSSDWEDNKGQEQTRYFYSLLMEMLPQWVKTSIRTNGYRVVDFGCALGQGVPILAEGLGDAVRGVDFSETAVKQAKAAFPAFYFEQADVRNYRTEMDVAVLSNIIEHFSSPFEIVRNLSSNVKKYIIIMVPLEERNLMAEHVSAFFYSNIPVSIDRFQLVFFAEHDCRNDSEQLFLAKQILLVYSCDRTVNESLSIESIEGIEALRDHQKQEQKQFRASLDILDQQIQSVQRSLQSDLQEFNNQYVQGREMLSSQIETIRQKLQAAEQTLQLSLHDQLTTQKNDLQENISLQIQQAMEKVAQKQAERESLLHAQQQEIYSQQREIDRLRTLYKETDAKFIELVNRFNALNDAYALTVAENVDIKQSKTYRVALLQKKIARKLHLIGPMKFFLLVRRFGWKEAIRQRKLQKKRINMDAASLRNKAAINEAAATVDPMEAHVQETIRCRITLYGECIRRPQTELDRQIERIFETHPHKGIVVYPHAVHWEPMQRPQHLLRAFAREGYLCFFCEEGETNQLLYEAAENVFVVYGEENLLPALQNRCPIVLTTYFMQSVFVSFLPQKVLWFDILDNLEFFGGGDTPTAKRMWPDLQRGANLISYSADNLASYLENKVDALKLNNGVTQEDFCPDAEPVPIEKLQKIKDSGKKIVGYYGAIEEWLDTDAIHYLADHTECEIVLIGKVGIDLAELKKLPHVHILGTIPYNDLKNYSRYFDVALIPFVVNKLTNSVSPVKFYEYAAQGIPVVSSNIQEMKQYVCEGVRLYETYEELANDVSELCTKPVNTDKLREIASQNTWDMRARQVLEVLNRRAVGLHSLADFRDNGTVSVLSVTFFKYDGTTYFSGGAERYLLELHEVCKEIDFPYRVYQYGEYDWVRFYGDVEVVGLGARKNDVNTFTFPLAVEMKERFSAETAQNGLVNIYSPFYILTQKDQVPSIGISHGISWDSEYTHFTDGNTFWQINRSIIDAAGYCDRMISVDTNTCNWFQTLDYETGRKIRYIPNYVDTAEFHPREDYLQSREKTVITYPRRLYGARGLYVILDIIDDVLERYPNVEFHFVGKGFEADTKNVEKKVQKWSGRVKWYSRAPDKMYEVYQHTDISLIPTMYSEGTSLSCLEALSSGNAVIATRVGGLTDLILSGFNGILVEPNAEAIKEALYHLLDHPEEMVEIKKRAVASAEAFSKKQWKERWKQSLQSVLANTPDSSYRHPKRCMIHVENAESIHRPRVLQEIREYLCGGWYVYVAAPRNPWKNQSYKRLQFIDQNEDLYFVPEKTIFENELDSRE